MKRDGHTHSHFCQHASGEETEEFILRAIEQGFEVYSVTEHLPFPENYLEALPLEREFLDSLKIKDNDFDAYIREIERLKKKYRDKVHILIGAEIDFLPGHLDFSRDYLKEYGPYLEDALLSVHMIYGTGGPRCIDHNPADFTEGLLDYYSTYENVQLEYYRMVQEALAADMGPCKPKRIGHLTLCNKFQHYFNQAGIVGEPVKKAILNVLGQIKEKGYELDVNAAGLFKEFCREIYPSPWIIKTAGEMKIPLVYGSDAHAVEHIGRGYDIYKALVCGS